MLARVADIGEKWVGSHRQAAHDASYPWEPSVYAPPPGTKPKALALTLLLFASIVGGIFITWSRSSYVISKPASPLVMNLLPVASPLVREQERDKPAPRKRRDKEPTPPKPEIVPKPVVSLPRDKPTPPPLPTPPVQLVPSRPVEDSAPKAIPAPPAPQASSNAPDISWRGRVLARLSQYRRYPSDARNQHEEGVPYIRFVMDRDGKVLSSRLEHSSGFSDLDHEAVTLPKRAQPLPKPPVEVIGDTIELVVPVEFFLHG